MPSSKLQTLTRDTLKRNFGGYVIYENIRPSWCLNRTGYRLELDFLIPELNVAIEVQGQQHYTFSPFMHGTPDRFELQIERDILKRNNCKEHNILLLEVFDTPSLQDAIDQIRSLPLGGFKPNMPVRRTDWAGVLGRWLEKAEYLLKRRAQDEYTVKCIQHCHKLIHWMQVHVGDNILSFAQPDDAQRIVWILNKMSNVQRSRKKRKKHEKRTLKESNKGGG